MIARQYVAALPGYRSEIAQGIGLKQRARLELIGIVGHVEASGPQWSGNADANARCQPKLPLGRRAFPLPNHSGIDKAGILREYKRKQRFKSAGELRREKAKAAARRRTKRPRARAETRR